MIDEAFTNSRRALLLELSDVEFQNWRHHPITAAYLQFLRDQIENHREAIMDLLESGRVGVGAENPDLNSNYLRGRILTLREIEQLSLDQIRQFYIQAAETDEIDEDAARIV